MTKAEFIEYVSLRYDELKSLNESESLYEFEKQIVDSVNLIGHELIRSKIELKTKDRRKKKVFKGQFGSVELPLENKLVKEHEGPKVLPLWKEKLVLVGVHEPYSNGSQLIKNLFDQEVSPTMIYRLTDKVGEQSESIIAELDDSGKRSFGEQEGMCVNVALDGSMILTREEKWKECKLGRVFQQETSKTKEDNAKVKFL